METLGIFVMIITAVAFIQADTTPEFTLKLQAVTKGCKVGKATDQDVEDVIHLRSNLTTEAKCILKCGLERLGSIKDEKFVEPSKIIVNYNKLFEGHPEKLEHGDEVVDKCTKRAQAESPNDMCEASFVVLKCFLDIV